jgi:hypothetical protein
LIVFRFYPALKCWANLVRHSGLTAQLSVWLQDRLELKANSQKPPLTRSSSKW